MSDTFPVDASAPQDTAPDASSQAVVVQADRLGLQWQLRPAVVVQTNPLLGLYDGDDASISLTSMVGSVSPGQRVYVIKVPPAGNFITGFQNGIYRARVTLAATQTTISFTNIPSALRRIQVTWTARGDQAAAAILVRMVVNGVAAGYNSENTTANGAAMASSLIDSGATSAFIGQAAGATASANFFGSGTVNIQSWDNSLVAAANWTYQSQAMVSGGITQTGGGSVPTAKPYTSLSFRPASGSFVSGTDFQIEGSPS